MLVKNCIENLKTELQQENKHVELYSVREAEVSTEIVTVSLLSKAANYDREIKKPDSTVQQKGVEITFDIVPKGKRKAIKKRFYFVYE